MPRARLTYARPPEDEGQKKKIAINVHSPPASSILKNCNSAFFRRQCHSDFSHDRHLYNHMMTTKKNEIFRLPLLLEFKFSEPL